MRYRPALSVTVLRTFSINAGLAASTDTPGSTAPDESFTIPAMIACAQAVDCTASKHASIKQRRTHTRIVKSPFVNEPGPPRRTRPGKLHFFAYRTAVHYTNSCLSREISPSVKTLLLCDRGRIKRRFR